jgi:hypothetical protein
MQIIFMRPGLGVGFEVLIAGFVGVGDLGIVQVSGSQRSRRLY